MPLDTLLAKYPGATTFTFGDSESLCDELLALVRAGRKTATCDALRTYERDRAPLPIVGRRDVALHWNGTPALVIETTSVERMRFRDVDESFALAEGENDDLEGWRADHAAYFERTGGFDPDMELVCERFVLVEDLGPRR